MEKIKEVITKIENGQVHFADKDPSYHELEYVGSVSNMYIIHVVEVEKNNTDEDEEELEVFFAERDFVKEMRNEVFADRKTEDDLINLIGDLNELEDQYDYNKVVAYRNGYNIEWL